MDASRDIGRHDADIQNIKEDVKDIKTSLEKISEYVIGQQQAQKQKTESARKQYMIVGLISTIISGLYQVLSSWWSSKGYSG